MADPSASASASASSSRPAAVSPKQLTTCLCSPTNHPGSFRCSRHRSPRGRPSSSSAYHHRASQAAPGGVQVARGEGTSRSGGGGGGAGRGKGRPVLRAHLLRMISPPSTSGRDHRRLRRDFQPRPSRLGLVSA